MTSNIDRTSSDGSNHQLQNSSAKAVNTGTVDCKADDYLKQFNREGDIHDVTIRELHEHMAGQVTSKYNDLATDFYKYGFGGDSFHFAMLRKGESREHSIAKYEYSIALKLELKPGELVLVSEK